MLWSLPYDELFKILQVFNFLIRIYSRCFVHDILQSFMLGHTSVSRRREREFSAASCSFRHTTVVLGSEQNPLLFWPLAYNTSAKATILEKQKKSFAKLHHLNGFMNLRKQNISSKLQKYPAQQSNVMFSAELWHAKSCDHHKT